MRKINGGSRVMGRLPGGCILCHQGAKMVLFVTGLCGAQCFYCPLSEKKTDRDVVYANERFISDPDDVHSICQEAESIDALGTGITGGEPLLVLDRTLAYIRALKAHFGPEHHIHLYTAVSPSREQLHALKEAGLDEIRFHLEFQQWYPAFSNESTRRETPFDTAIEEALGLGLGTGVEIPLIPGLVGPYFQMMWHLDRLGCQFLNLNELEYSPTNYQELNTRDFTVKSDVSSAVFGSEGVILQMLEWFEVMKDRPKMTLHFCSVSFKDGTQLRRRLIRQALKRARPYEDVTTDGTLVKGILEFPQGSTKEELDNFLAILGEVQGDVPESMFFLEEGVSGKGPVLETSTELIRKIAQQTPFPCFIVETYPSADCLEVEREPVSREPGEPVQSCFL